MDHQRATTKSRKIPTRKRNPRYQVFGIHKPASCAVISKDAFGTSVVAYASVCSSVPNSYSSSSSSCGVDSSRVHTSRLPLLPSLALPLRTYSSASYPFTSGHDSSCSYTTERRSRVSHDYAAAVTCPASLKADLSRRLYCSIASLSNEAGNQVFQLVAVTSRTAILRGWRQH